MDLIEILDKILRVKNQLRDILDENDNFSRYPTAIYNYLVTRYNEGWVRGYSERYFFYNGREIYNIEGPKELIINYGVNPEHYDVYDTGALVNLMSDVLNYKILSKENLEVDDDLFMNYPSYLEQEYGKAYEEGLQDGAAKMDEDYGDAGEVSVPVLDNDDNLISFTTEFNSIVYYSINEDGSNGPLKQYTDPFYIGGPCTITYYAKRGVRQSETVTETLEYDPEGKTLVFPPTIEQQDDYLIIKTTTPNALVEYHLDSNDFQTYFSKVPVTNSNRIVYARATRGGNYSATVSQTISHTPAVSKPANVRCSITTSGNNKIITLSCPTSGTVIHYAINDRTGEYLIYSNPVTVTYSAFEIWAYSEVGGVSSSVMYYKYDPADSPSSPLPPQAEIGPDYIRIYTLSVGAIIKYQYPYGNIITTSSNEVVLYPPDNSTIYAWSHIDGQQDAMNTFYFNRTAKVKLPAPDIQFKKGAMVIVSPYTVKYTFDGTSPLSNDGTVYTYENSVLLDSPVYVRAVVVDPTGVYDPSIIVEANISPEEGIDFNYEGENGQTSGGDLNSNYFWFRPVAACTIQFTGSLSYSVDKTQFITISTGAAFSTSGQKYYLRGNNLSNITFSSEVSVGGNIFSLGLGNSFSSTNYTGDVSFKNLFKETTVHSIKDASELVIPVTKISEGQFESLFENCTALTIGPRIGESGVVTSVGTGGMRRMFKGCTSLNSVITSFDFGADSIIGYEAMKECFMNTNISNVSLNIDSTVKNPGQYAFQSCFENCYKLSASNINLNLMVLSNSVYEAMFKNCKVISSFGNLPALAAATDCYKEMFYGCNALRSFGNLALTSVAPTCCDGMFYETAIEYAPRLNTINLYGGTGCYNNMFTNCRALKYIEALFLQAPQGNYTSNWTYGVAQYGEYKYNEQILLQDGTLRWNPENYRNRMGFYSGIPAEWTLGICSAWGTITSIKAFRGTVTIVADSTHYIWYSINNNTSWLRYDPNNKPTIVSKSIIRACCGPEDADQAKLNNGQYGSVYTIELDPNFSDLTPYSRDKKIFFNGDDTYTIVFKVNDSQMYQWINYKEDGFDPVAHGIIVDESWRVHVYAEGRIGNADPVIFDGYISLDVDAPAIHFNSNANYTANYFSLSYPNPYNQTVSFKYKYNDETSWTYVSATYESGNGGRWQTTVKIPSTVFNSTNRYLWVYAIAVKSDGSESGQISGYNVYQEGSSGESFKSIEIDKPDGANYFYIKYGGQRLESASGDNPSFWFQINSAQQIRYGNGVTTPPICPYNFDTTIHGSNNIKITVYARKGALDSVSMTGTFTFSYSDWVNNGITLETPTFHIRNLGDKYNIVMTNPTVLTSGNYQIFNQVRIKAGTGNWTAAQFTLNPNAVNVWNGWQNILSASGNSGGLDIPNTLYQAVFEYRSILGSTDNSTEIYEYPDDGSVWTNNYAPISVKTPYCTQDGNRLIITKSDIDDFDYATVYMRVEPNTDYWVSGFIDHEKYNGYKAANIFVVYDQNGEKYRYFDVDTHLKYADIYIKYFSNTYQIESEEFKLKYENASVKEVSDTTCKGYTYANRNFNVLVCYIEDNEKGIYYNCNRNYVPIVTTHDNNLDSVSFKFRIKQGTTPVWGGGVLDNTIYNNWTKCDIPYGIYLHDALISATFEIKALDSNNLESGVGEVVFSNSLASLLAAPDVNINVTNYGDEVVVENKERRATNWFKLENSEYNPTSATRKHIDGQWYVCSGSTAILSQYLVSSYIYGKSTFGSEEKINSTYIPYNNSNLHSAVYNPPTVWTEPITGTNTYNLCFKNNCSDVDVKYLKIQYYNLNWKYNDDTPWNANNYYEPKSDANYKVLECTYNNTVKIPVDKTLINAEVTVFASDYNNKNVRRISVTTETASTSYVYHNSYWD